MVRKSGSLKAASGQASQTLLPGRTGPRYIDPLSVHWTDRAAASSSVVPGASEIMQKMFAVTMSAARHRDIKGIPYPREKFDQAVNEVRRFFSRQSRGLASLDKIICEMQEDHRKGRSEQDEKRQKEMRLIVARRAEELNELRGHLQALEEAELRRQVRKTKVRNIVKKSAAWLVFLGVPVGTAIVANRLGSGQNVLQRLVSLWPVLAVSPLLSAFFIKILILRKERLREVFSIWREVRGLFK